MGRRISEMDFVHSIWEQNLMAIWNREKYTDVCPVGTRIDEYLSIMSLCNFVTCCQTQPSPILIDQ